MKNVTLKTWVYAVPAASTRKDRRGARSQMLPEGAIVNVHKDDGGPVLIISGWSSVFGKVLAPIGRNDVTF